MRRKGRARDLESSVCPKPYSFCPKPYSFCPKPYSFLALKSLIINATAPSPIDPIDPYITRPVGQLCKRQGRQRNKRTLSLVCLSGGVGLGRSSIWTATTPLRFATTPLRFLCGPLTEGGPRREFRNQCFATNTHTRPSPARSPYPPRSAFKNPPARNSTYLPAPSVAMAAL